MKWRLTGRYLLSIVLVVILVVISNILLLIGLAIVQTTLDVPIFQSNEISTEIFTRKFQNQITTSNNQVIITEKGKTELVDNKAWIQILDENGKEIYGYMTPKGVKKKYTPVESINLYKYKEANVFSTVFASEKVINDKHYSYFIGFKDPNINKTVFSYDSRHIAHVFKVGSLTLLILDGAIALLIGYLFSRRLTLPINKLIDRIKGLANKEYNEVLKPNGLYKDVIYNVNNLSYQLKANEIERKKLDKLKEEWIGNISHDIKTPLASIRGYAELMKDPDYQFSQEELREYAEIIERKSLYIKDVIEDLNLSTRLKNKDLSLNKKTINIVALLRNIIIDMLNDTKYSNRDIEFQYEIENINMDIDETLLRRTINNLIYNAIVHNDENVKIIVSVEKTNERTHIKIQDNGKGIKKEELERIFDRYYRGTNTGESHKGSGLGMAIAHDIILAHGGEIKVNSLVGHGTTIDIFL
jgi:signal transduction histidine kinase